MDWLETFEFLSYIVTVVGLPAAIVIFFFEQRKERQNESEEVYQRLSDEYANFLKLVLENSDLLIFREGAPLQQYTEEQKERRLILFEILTSLFERSYLLVYDQNMNRQNRRLWLSWDDYMREWCRREDYRSALPILLPGEDEEFVAYIKRIAEEERVGSRSPVEKKRD